VTRRAWVREFLRTLSASPPSTDDRLSLCRLCGADAVAVIDWSEEADPYWKLWIRCGECGRSRHVTAHEDEVSELMAELEAHAFAIDEAARALARCQMKDDLRILCEAFARDLIDPGDFVR
jgi:hypothetical protein